MLPPEPLKHASYFFRPQDWDAASGKLAILFHGLTGAPWEMLSVAQALCSEGFKVIVPCLPGHGTSVEDLRVTPLTDFTTYASFLLQHIPRAPTIIGGLSFGSLMTLWCAEHAATPPRAIVLLAPPFRLRKVDRILSVVSYLPDRWLNMLGLTPKASRSLPLPKSSYSAHSIAGAARLTKLRRAVLQGLSKLKMPVLMIQDPFDHHLEPDATEKAVEYFGSDEVDTLWMPHGEHELTLGPNSEAVSGAIVEFVRRAMSNSEAVA